MSRFESAPWPLKAAYFTLLASLGAAAIAGGATLIALAGLHRLSAHLDLASVPGWFWYFRADPLVHRWLLIGGMTALLVSGLVAFGAVQSRRPPLHGAARWASEAELRREGLRAKRGIILGRRNGRLLVFGGAEHVMLYAPTRTGKGVGVVIPNLLSWPDSVVVLDVKRENWTASAGFRSCHGQRVLLFDPLDAEGRTARFNPLGHIDRTDPIAVMDELQKLSVMLFPAPRDGDPFWAEAARTGFIGVGGYVAATPDLKFSLGTLYRELTDGDPRTRLPAAVAARVKAGRPLPAACASALSDFCSASENTFASIKQTLTARMNLWLNPRICAATDVSDFDLRDLRSKRISLYLAVSPDNLERVAPLYNLLLQQLIDLNTRSLPDRSKSNIEVLLLLDEFARLGHAAVIARGFSYVAGYGLRLLPVLQSPAQLRREYGADLAEEIMANCGVEVAFAPKELKTAQDLSERLGFWTYSGRSQSRPTLLSQGNRSTTESDQRRALLMPQELIQMSSKRLVILRAGIPPVRGDKIHYWRERVFTTRLSPPPTVEPFKDPGATLGDRTDAAASGADAPPPPPPEDHLTLDLIIPALAENGLEALPAEGADAAEVEAWVERFIDASVHVDLVEACHGR